MSSRRPVENFSAALRALNSWPNDWKSGMKNDSLASADAPAHLSERRFSQERIQNWLIAKLAELRGIEPNDLSPDEPFRNYGLASIDMVGLSGELEDWLGRSLSP